MELDLRYAFTTTAAPVQAEGTLGDRQFYFRSRYEEWTFAVAERPGVDPADLEDVGDEDRGWVQTGRFTERYAGSYLSATDADVLIRRCAAAYLAARAS